ncbi:MAG: type IV pilus modification protein PilV [Pseudomonadota bacterium]|nr:type IV pilus modification protein PilV [Pseudomonadota bacterium]
MRMLRSQHGASLIEVLVAMTILAVGILGINAMQTSTLKSNQNSYMRTQAVYLAQDIVERVRSNAQGAEAGNYNDPAPVLTAACQTAAGCTAAQMAANDVAQWEAAVAAALPAGAGVVCLDATPDDGTSAAPACSDSGTLYAVKIWWDDNRDGTASERYVMPFQP